MADNPDQVNDVRESDLVFDCPYCGKSLAIDYRGAGLNIQCSDCGRNVQVPIPEGMDISDLDSSVEEQEIRILNLRRALSAAEERINQLEPELKALHGKLAGLSQGGSGQDGLKEILEQTREIQQNQVRILSMLDSMAAAGKEE